MNSKKLALLMGCTILTGLSGATKALAQDAIVDAQASREAVEPTSPVDGSPDYDVRDGGGEFYFGGQIRQGISLALDPEIGKKSAGPSQFTLQAQATYKPVDSLTLKADLWLRGDFFYELNDGRIKQSGLKDITSGAAGFLTPFEYNLSQAGNTQAGLAALPQPYGDNGRDARLLSDFNDDVIRELSASYADPGGAFNIQAGKFQRGWGQADGIRLLDVIYAQDLRQRAIFTDTEDLRLPSWTVALDVNLEAAGLSAPFEALGMQKPTFEFLFIPEVRHTEVVVNNPTPSSRTNGGLFGLPFPSLVDGGTGLGLPFIGVNLTTKDFDPFEEQAYGARLKFGVLGGEATLNGFYGYQDLPTIEMTGAQLILGSALNDPSAPGAVAVPLDVASTVGAAHAPGQYLDFLGSLKAGAPIAFPLSPFGCGNPLVTAPTCSVNFDFDLNYTHRKKLVGFSFIRDMVELPMGPKGVTPVIRLEASYEFDKPFNVGRFETPFGTTATGSSALVAPASASVVERDQWSVMLGFDYNLWFPFWKSQEASLFMTTQFFNIHTDNPKDLLYQAPYAFDFVEEDHQFFTQTWSLPIRNETITFDGLLVADLDKNGLSYRQRIDFGALGGKLKPRIEYGYFSGNKEGGLLGYFRNSDYLEFSIAYQF